MKKFLMTLAAVVIAASASAQVYVGGNVGISSTKVEGQDSKTQYSFLPEIGYNINNDWAVGVEFGWRQGTTFSFTDVEGKVFEVAPYARYTFFHSKLVNAFVDGAVTYSHENGAGDYYSIGLKPGVSVNLTKKLSFVAHVGFLGYRKVDYKNNYKVDGKDTFDTSSWGLNLDGNNILFGLYYNF